MIAVNQVLTPKVTQGTVSDEAVADPEIPFSNTLDELLEDSMTEFEAEDLLLGELEEGQLMAEQGLGEEAILVEENILETLTDDENQIALAVPMAPEFVPDSQTRTQTQNGESIHQQSGLSRLEVLQQGKQLSEEFLLVPEQRVDNKTPDKKILANLQNSQEVERPFAELISESKSVSKVNLDESSSAHPFTNMKDVFQKTEPVAEVGDKLDQMQAVLKQQFRAENIDDVQAETQQEQILNAGLIKPGEQVQAAATRVPIESRIRIGSEQTESTFSLKSGLEPVPGLEPVTASSNFQSQLISKVEGAQQTQNNVQAPELPFDVEQVMGRVRVLRENDSQQITLRLQPDHLGQVTMKVRQTGGELQVDMRVDNMMAKQIIEAGFDTLKSRFLDQELAYDQLSLNIEVDQRSASQYDRDQQNSGFGEENASRSRGETEQETIPDPMNSRPIVNNDSALNIYV